MFFQCFFQCRNFERENYRTIRHPKQLIPSWQPLDLSVPPRLCTPGGRCGWQASSRGAVDIRVRRWHQKTLTNCSLQYLGWLSVDIFYLFKCTILRIIDDYWIYDVFELCRKLLQRILWFNTNSTYDYPSKSFNICLHQVDINLQLSLNTDMSTVVSQESVTKS